jgi:hypothetical protein
MADIDSRRPTVRGNRLRLVWLGRQDSNLGMLGSKPSALPLGDAPKHSNAPKKPVA